MIPVQGRVDDPKAAILPMIGNVLRNALIRAYGPNIKNLIQLERERSDDHSGLDRCA